MAFEVWRELGLSGTPEPMGPTLKPLAMLINSTQNANDWDFFFFFFCCEIHIKLSIFSTQLSGVDDTAV